MFDPLTSATLTLDQIVDMCDELIAPTEISFLRSTRGERWCREAGRVSDW